jgi:hypothetical protein
MARKVRIKAGYHDVVLPGGGLPVSEGDEVWLTEADYGALSATAKTNVVEVIALDSDNDTIPDDEEEGGGGGGGGVIEVAFAVIDYGLNASVAGGQGTQPLGGMEPIEITVGDFCLDLVLFLPDVTAFGDDEDAGAVTFSTYTLMTEGEVQAAFDDFIAQVPGWGTLEEFKTLIGFPDVYQDMPGDTASVTIRVAGDGTPGLCQIRVEHRLTVQGTWNVLARWGVQSGSANLNRKPIFRVVQTTVPSTEG